MTVARARLAILFLVVVAAIAGAAYWVARGTPVDIVDAPTGRISCVSYAPYRLPGESPFTVGYKVTAERIDEDLKALSRHFDCVRTYSVGQGLDQVPAIAKKYGMKVLLGIWLSRDPVDNQEELTEGIALAKRERDAIRAIVVGNEVLLRGELPQRTIADHLRRVKAETGLPVTYADVWEFWLKYGEVAPAVDFLTIHILPYWEDKPVPVGQAIAHVGEIYRYMQGKFPGREFLIGETGWPSEGRQRWEAIPSRVNEARFFREFMNFAQKEKLPYNVIEAFDQPWKRQLEGTVGGYWGLYDDQLRDKFPLTGPVVEDARWWVGFAAGGAAAIAFVLFGLVGAPRSATALGFRLLAGFFTGAVVAAQVKHYELANRNLFETVLMTSTTVIAAITAAVVFEQVARWLARRDAGTPAGAAPLVTVFRGAGLDRLNGVLLGFWLVAGAIVNLLLVFDARYRDFPSLLFAPVIVAFAALALARRVRFGRGAQVEEKLLVGSLVVGAAIIVVTELPINLSADLWAGLCLLFAAAAWLNVRRA